MYTVSGHYILCASNTTHFSRFISTLHFDLQVPVDLDFGNVKMKIMGIQIFFSHWRCQVQKTEILTLIARSKYLFKMFTLFVQE